MYVTVNSLRIYRNWKLTSLSLHFCHPSGTSPQGEALARGIKDKVNELRSSISSAIVAADKSGTVQTAHTVAGRLEQANKWLLNPQHDDKGLGQKAIALIIHEGKKVISPRLKTSISLRLLLLLTVSPSLFLLYCFPYSYVHTNFFIKLVKYNFALCFFRC